MLLQEARALHHSIEEKRNYLYEIIAFNGITNPYTIYLSQQLDSEITELQRLMENVKEQSKSIKQKEIIFELLEECS